MKHLPRLSLSCTCRRDTRAAGKGFAARPQALLRHGPDLRLPAAAWKLRPGLPNRAPHQLPQQHDRTLLISPL